MRTIRCKFVVNSARLVGESSGGSGAFIVNATPVSGSVENNTFWKLTPNGSLQLTITNPECFGVFEDGDEIYVDLTKAGE